MFKPIPRKHVQAVSFLLFSLGAFILVCGGWQSELSRAVGISLMAGSIWFIMMSESVLLTKVQNEMHGVLEQLSARREREIEELLYFLRDAKLRRDPWSSIDAASTYIQKIPFPAWVITPEIRVHKINKAWTKTLEWDESICGKSAIPFQCTKYWGELSSILANAADQKDFMHFSKYCYLSKSGREVFGTVAIFIFPDMSGCAAVFYPDEQCVISKKL